MRHAADRLIGFIAGVICVALIVMERDVNWPIGIVNSLAFVVVFGRAKLYSQMGLQIFYLLEGDRHCRAVEHKSPDA